MKLSKLNILPKLACFVLFAGLILFLGSCASYKRCSSKFNWQSDTIKTVVYRDTTIKVVIHGTDTVLKKAYITDTLYFQSGTAHSVVYVKHDTIIQQLWTVDTIAQVKLDSVIKESTIVNKQFAVKTEEGRGAKFLSKLFGCLLAIAVIALIIVVVPRILKKK